MKRLSVLVSSLFIFLGLFVSCKNDIKTEKKAYLTFGDVSRVIQPTQLSFADDEEISFELKGKDEKSEFSTLRTWLYNEENGTAYNQMIQSNIPIELGEWDFELLAIKNDQPFLKGSIVDKNIVIGENILNFGTMEILKEDGLTGSINFKLEFPFDEIKAIKCGLYDLNSNVAIENFESEWLDISLSEEGSRFVCYEKTDVPVGIYFMKFELYSDEKAENRIKVYSPVINVVAGHLTEGEDVLENINTFYTIEYELNGASWKGGYEPETYFNKNALVYLPDSTHLVYEGYNFLGWYIDDEEIESPYSYSETTSSVITLTAHWEENLSVIYSYNLGKQEYASDDGASLVPDGNNLAGAVTKYKATVNTPDNSLTVWDYYVQPEDVSFTTGVNYAVSVKLKSKKDTVVGIQAANADMFFTVGTDWTTCTFETGFIEKALSDEKNGITIGFALAEEIYISSLKITPIEENDDNLPTLAFNVTKQGIENYLNTDNRPEKIIEVEKTSSNDSYDGYNIKINTPLAHSEANTDGQSYLVEDVTLEIRDYVSSNGLNKACFNMSVSDSDLQTALEAKTDSSNMYSTRWNSSTTVNSNEIEAYTVFFPSYKTESTEEFFLDGLLKGGNDSSTTINLSKFEISSATTQDVLDAGKVFIIKGGNTFYRCDSITKEFVIKKENPLYCDVLLAVPKDSSGNSILKENGGSFEESDYNQFGWIDCIRFIPNNVSSTDSFTINIEKGEDGKPSYFVLTNKKDEEITLKISLDDECKVQIEEVITGGGTGEGEDVGGITYASLPNPDVTGSIDTFYISDSTGLKTYRDLINGTKGFSLSIQPENGSSYTRQFDPSATSRYDAILTSNITIEDAWIPIGTGNYPFKSSFDGQGHSITFAETSSFSGDYAGVFGYVGNQSASTTSISNLVVKGQDAGITTSAQYAGGIVAYSYGATISNCVNKLKINNTHSNEDDFGVGGIVGIVEKPTVISGCVNFVDLVNACVGGIVGIVLDGNVNNEDELTVTKCINLGKIQSQITNAYLSGGVGKSYGSVTITDCINLGEIGWLNSANANNNSGFANVISNGSLNISTCINAGPYPKTSNNSLYAIAYGGEIVFGGKLYYNSDKWKYTNIVSGNEDSYTPSENSSSIVVEGKSTSELCALTTTELSDNWSCVTDGTRYPLPNILGADENSGVSQSIWQEICYAAKVEVSSGGGEDEITNVATSFEELNNLISSVSSGYAVDNPYVIGIENDITIESKITIANHIKLVSLREECKLVRSESLQEDNLFLVSADASLTLGDSDSTGSLVIDGGAETTSTTLKKSLINVSTSGTLVLNENSILQNNNRTASYDATHGGAIYSSGGNININGGTIRNNSTSYKKHLGGAIYLENGTFTMTAGSFENNSTYENGGALYLESCETNITGGNFTGNSTTTGTTSCYGGAIYIITSGTANISNCTFESNTAYQRGGAIYTGGTGNVEIKKCNFKNNTVSNSTAKGGAIYVENTDGSVSVNECMFDSNTIPAIAKTQSSMVVTVDGEEINSDEWDPS